MAKYLLIESRDPFDSADSAAFSELVNGIAKRGNEVTLFLLQNGVFPARRGAKFNDKLKQLAQSKVKIYADDFSLRERAIKQPVDGVQVGNMDQLIKLMLEPGTKAVWH